MQLRHWVKAGKPIAGAADGDGLTFTLSVKGAATWVFRYRFGAKQRELTLGRYPDFGVKEARKLATEARFRLHHGADVARQKQLEKAAQAAAGTVKELCDEYFERMVAGKIKRPEMIRAMFDNDLIRVLGHLRIAEVKPIDVDRLIKSIVDRGAPIMANRTLQITKSLFDFAVRRHWVEQNPAAAFRRADAGGEEKARERALSEAEIVKLFAAFEQEGSKFRLYALAVRLLLLTAVRKTELIAAPWVEFDLEGGLWVLPKDRTKTKREFTIPLPAAAIGWLNEIKRFSPASEYVFPPKRRTGRSTMSPETLNWAMREIEHGLAPFTLHDLRRTARTHLADDEDSANHDSLHWNSPREPHAEPRGDRISEPGALLEAPAPHVRGRERPQTSGSAELSAFELLSSKHLDVRQVELAFDPLEPGGRPVVGLAVPVVDGDDPLQVRHPDQ